MAREAQLRLKRLFDILVCTVLLVSLAPVLLMLAVVVRMTSPGPILYVQERAGLGGKPFRIIKFRTMSGTADPAKGPSPEDDVVRMTRVGSILRDYGLDELPQLVNILRGEMSIIGPRPILVQQVGTLPHCWHRMFDMRPGVLSLAAVEGRRSIPMERRYELHTQYVNEWSLALDWQILWRSLFVVLRREAARDDV